MLSDAVNTDERSRAGADAGAENSFLVQAKRYIPLAVWIVAVLTVLLIPLRIVSYGYLPTDDALRHAAKAVSGKPWSDILVMRSDFPMDPHPGWHAILGAMYHWQNWDTDKLVSFSVVSLMLLVNLCVLPWLRRPEAWLGALVVAVVCIPRFVARTAYGRPYIFVIAVLITLLFLWSRVGNVRPRAWLVLCTVPLIAAAAWIHGSWYLLALPAAALLLTGWWRPAIWLGCCWLAGSFLGGCLTGHPVQYLGQEVRHMLNVFGDHAVARQLANELAPSDGDVSAVLAIVAVLFWRALTPGWKAQQLVNPFFMLGLLGWLLSFAVLRFWWDWGLPAMMLWMTLEFQKQFERYQPFDSWQRGLVTLALAVGAYLGATNDYGSRWTSNLTNEYLVATPDKPDLAEWLPEPGGIIYSADMRVFYDTFFKHPKAPWKYVLGYEPGLLRKADHDVVYRVFWNFGDVRAYEPWVQKMRPEDRLIIRASWLPGGGPPNIPQLQWHYAVSDLWIGRLPRGTNSPAALPLQT